MQDSKPKYWRGIEELENTPEFVEKAQNEFPEYLPILNNTGTEPSAFTAPRRDFLKLLGFSVAAASLAACEAPVKKAIPYLNKPEEIDPSIANWYASTSFMGGIYNPVLVKTREGRPIKVEGNPQSTLTQGGLHARGQASVLSLYDEGRMRNPQINKKDASWQQADQEIISKLGAVKGRVAVVSSTIISPSTKRVINEFLAKYPGGEHVMYDANSASGMLRASQSAFGRNGIPSIDFSKAMAIVGVGADFLGTWLSPVEFARQYITNRKVSADNRRMSKHYQFEGMMSLTGANADVRVPVKPSEEAAVIAALHSRIVGGGGVSAPNVAFQKQIDEAAAVLQANRGAAVVVSDHKDAGVQLLVNQINQALGAVGTIIRPEQPMYVRQGDDSQMMRLISDMNAGTVGAVIFMGANPVYDHPMSEQVVSGLKNVGLTISLSDRADETAQFCTYLCPDHHYLESWNDFEPKKGYFSFAQPAISPLFNTRQAQDSLLVWTGTGTDYYAYLQRNWRSMMGSVGGSGNFQAFWDRLVHDGVYETTAGYTSIFDAPNTTATAAPVTTASVSQAMTPGTGLELALYESIPMGCGDMGNNPWLLELSDPITKACWDNYICMSQAMSKKLKLAQNDMAKVTVKGRKGTVELPVLVQPGMPDNTIAIAIGWGRTHAGPAANGVGANAFQLAGVDETGVRFMLAADIAKGTGERTIAQEQTHHTIMDRLVVQDATLAQYQKDPKSVTEYVRVATPLSPTGEDKPTVVSLWKDYEYKNHHWGMVIDLNSCIGCGSCVVGCQAENNVPVVGRQEVINRRDMKWLRIDRYYNSDSHREDGFVAMEEPAANPSVIFQPMLCQHCNHAPCETVCPVAATMHSSEGLNQMAYNRCIGTRYCANNCPYKVRRFNWFNYQNDERVVGVNLTTELQRMVLNPDVTVRARGVMEKCSFCVQRIQLGKLEAKKDRRRPKDGEIVTACAQSCPTNAIVFGDMNDPESQVYQLLRREDGERAFHVLAELNTQPNVTYLTKIRNTEQTLA